MLDELFVKYGFLPFLLAINEFEREEQYEYCAILLTFIEEKNVEYGLDLPTRYNEEAISHLVDSLFTRGEVFFRSLPLYTQDIKEACRRF